MPEERLDDFTKEEWREVARRAVPRLTDEEFDQMWAEFEEQKRRKAVQ